MNRTAARHALCTPRHGSLPAYNLALKPGTTLQDGHFLIGSVLGKPGGFGVTYLGCDTKLQRLWPSRNFFPGTS
ncbi:MAG: hypothetical protein MZV63_63605 [Marinilabiliales bacterium]|nr:hypothetical protein [Marinilabiliales bacterium]